MMLCLLSTSVLTPVRFRGGQDASIGATCCSPQFIHTWPVPRSSKSAIQRSTVLRCALSQSRGESLHAFLLEAGFTCKPEAVEEMSAGFCNWVYRVDMPPPTGSLVVKLFSPLAKLRLAPELRGLGDFVAGESGIGPRLHFRNADGIINDFIPGKTLTESDIHEGSAELPERIARRLASLHLLDNEHTIQFGTQPVLWTFLDSMLNHIESGDGEGTVAASSLIDLSKVRAEVARMHERCESLHLPVVLAHGDLKPSNVMLNSATVWFIDFELTGPNYRCYDLFKLFRTASTLSTSNLQAFLTEYLEALPSTPSSPQNRQLLLQELHAETRAAEPLTWLEAAVFFLFAIRERPAEAERWAPLALQRWSAYLATSHVIDDYGAASSAMRLARRDAP